MTQSTNLSLADFWFADGDDPLVPPADFDSWLQDNAWAVSLLHPRMHGAVSPRMTVERGGQTKQVINLSSYNYLGLATHPDVLQAAAQALQQYGLGACGSPLLSGQADIHVQLEQELARMMGTGDSMLFNSGFGGGLGTIAGLLRKGDAAIVDERSHLCLMDGARLSGARLLTFAHNDPDALDAVLQRSAGKRRLVVVEGVYSMDGDCADLEALLPVAERHGVGLLVDEAHSILLYGEGGGGLVEHCGVEDRVALRFATFSKAFAAVGGFTAGAPDLLRYLRFYSNGYGFSCALPPAIVAALRCALRLATADDTLRARLWDNTEYFRQQSRALGLDMGVSTSQVIPIIIGSDRQLLYRLCQQMQDRGLFLAPVDYPAVPEDGLRYRVAITAAHSRQDLDEALNILNDTVVPHVDVHNR